jgi:hypothetical protein
MYFNTYWLLPGRLDSILAVQRILRRPKRPRRRARFHYILKGNLEQSAKLREPMTYPLPRQSAQATTHFSVKADCPIDVVSGKAHK